MPSHVRVPKAQRSHRSSSSICLEGVSPRQTLFFFFGAALSPVGPRLLHTASGCRVQVAFSVLSVRCVADGRAKKKNVVSSVKTNGAKIGERLRGLPSPCVCVRRGADGAVLRFLGSPSFLFVA